MVPAPRSEEPGPDRPRDPEEVYDLEREGEFPPPVGDVVFEEDELPPPPEEISSSPIDQAPLETESVGERGEVIQPIEPTVIPPVEPEVEERIPAKPPAVGVRGFRVQLVASSDRVEAERLALEAQTRLAVSVYVDHEAPFFKVRAGDFRDRAEALQLRERARANGYPEAWVVTTEIRTRAQDGER